MGLSKFTLELSEAPPAVMARTISDRTREVYDRLSFVYPASSFFFHRKAHREALRVSGIEDGMKILEVATGSGEMFRKLVEANPSGRTIGVDLSPKMAAMTQRHVRERYPGAETHCKAVDARHMPFRDESFDALVVCYLFELLATDDILLTLREFRRVLKPKGTLTLVLIGQNVEFFNRMYKVCGKVAPAFWGRQVDRDVTPLIESMQFRITSERTVRQLFYPSRVLTAHR